jgi:hypothetical protein
VFRGLLECICIPRSQAPLYDGRGFEGPPHRPVFRERVRLMQLQAAGAARAGGGGGERAAAAAGGEGGCQGWVEAEGMGESRKAAQAAAAAALLQVLRCRLASAAGGAA